jgi:hypothetical protein
MNANDKATELRRMHYKIIFDVDLGVNAEKDGERYLASIYAAKLTVQTINLTIENDVMLCKQVKRDFYTDVYKELLVMEQEALVEMG